MCRNISTYVTSKCVRKIEFIKLNYLNLKKNFSYMQTKMDFRTEGGNNVTIQLGEKKEEQSNLRKIAIGLGIFIGHSIVILLPPTNKHLQQHRQKS